MSGRALCFWIAAAASSASAARADNMHFHVEVDPTPFALGGYGVQLGIAHPALPGWRFGLGNFSLEVPDFAVQLNSANDGFHLRVRRSHALYVLRFFDRLRGFCVGGSMRYLRLEFTLDGAPGERARLGEFSIEAIGGYKWHPFERRGFYIMPWLAIAVPLAATRDATIDGRTYDTDFVQLFATANLGWQF